MEKQNFAERLKELTTKADAHREHALIKYRGWLPWRKLIEMRRDKEKQADLHYLHSVQR
jgi:hypothetical protein